jgi:hypothetical protein
MLCQVVRGLFALWLVLVVRKVMLRASVRAARQVAGRTDQTHLALKDVLTAEGTLMM